MSMKMRLLIACGLVLAGSFAAATLVLAVTEQTPPRELPHPAFNAGQAVGHLAWARDYCPGRQSDLLKLYFAQIARTEPAPFFRGFGNGEVDARITAKRQGPAAMCRRIEAMYGLDGTHIRNLWAPAGWLRSN